MCGINGIYAYRGSRPVDSDELIRIRDHMSARGPDGVGAWISPDNSLGFGHRRLSVIDLSAMGAQPMKSADGRFIVTFNGEIYNYRDLRRHLEGKGRVFFSQSDTEVLLHLYAEKGEAMVHELRGMFAFAIWNAESGSLFVARDPYGIKPLYYSDDGRTFRFASQVRALLAGGAVAGDPVPAGQVGFFYSATSQNHSPPIARYAHYRRARLSLSTVQARTKSANIIQSLGPMPRYEAKTARSMTKSRATRKSAKHYLIACDTILLPTFQWALSCRQASIRVRW